MVLQHDTERGLESSSNGNHYEVISLGHKVEHARERAPLISRTEFDSQAENHHTHPGSLPKLQLQPTLTLTIAHATLDEQTKPPESAYAEPTVILKTTTSAPPAVEKGNYDTVNSYLNQQVQGLMQVYHSYQVLSICFLMGNLPPHSQCSLQYADTLLYVKL